MPAVFVHGVPDTERMWDAVIAELDRSDVVAVSLPGFGNPRPAGFAATKEAYVDWLVDELRAIDGPIDLVGHDWGSILVARVVSTSAGLVRTWAAGSGPIDETYTWHDTAQMWQTPEVGEQFMAAMTPETMGPALEGAGLTAEQAARTAAHVDEDMKSCILDLYRSAIAVGQEWSADLGAVTEPGLVIWGTDDPFVTTDIGQRMADHTGATFLPLEGCGHWWPLERPSEVAAELTKFWHT